MVVGFSICVVLITRLCCFASFGLLVIEVGLLTCLLPGFTLLCFN